MAGQTYTVNVNTNTGVQNVNKLQTSLKTLEKNSQSLSSTFGKLQGVLAGLALGTMVKNVQASADAMVNLSRATDISVGSIAAFSQAMAVSGGTVDRARDAISDLTKNTGEAVRGSAELQKAFRSAGVSLKDLATLSQEDIFAKTLQGLTAIPDAATRSSTAFKLLGESVKGVDLDTLNAKFGVTAGSIGPYADSLKAAAAANTSLAQNFQNFTQALTSALEPINKLIAGINVSVETFASLIKILAAVGGAFLIFGKVLPFLTSTTNSSYKLVTGFKSMGKQVAAANGQFRRFIGHMGRVVTNTGKAGSRVASFGLGISQLLKSLARFAGIAGIIYAVAEAVNLLVKSATGFDVLGAALDKLGQGWDWLKEKIFGVTVAVDEGGAAAKRNSLAARKELREQADRWAEINQQLQIYKTELEASVGAYRAANAAANERFALETKLIGVSDAQRNSVLALQDAYQTYTNARAKMLDQLSKLEASGSEMDLLKAKEVRSAMGLLDKAYAENTVAITANQAAREAKTKSQIEETFRTQKQIEVERSLRKTQDDIAKISMTNMEKGYYDIAAAARESAVAAIEAEQARRKEKLSPAEVKRYYDEAVKGARKLIDQQKRLNDQSRTFSTGWNRAFRQYVENARDAAAQGERMFAKFTSGIEDLIVNFTKTGKFEWKNFVADMAEELLRSQIKSTMANILQMPNPFSSSGGSISDSLGGLFGGLMGDSGAARGQSANTPLYVLDVAGGGTGGGGLLAGGRSSGTVAGTGGGGIMDTISKIGTGIKDAASSVFSGIGKVASSIGSGIGSVVSTVGNVFGGGGGGGGGGGIMDTISNIGSSIGSAVSGAGSWLKDTFGGFFANGGQLGAGKFGIAGEAGPELISGPATITPMGMGGTTNVTYNINAVDAQSFKALIAADPGFIHAVAMKGAGSVPNRR